MAFLKLLINSIVALFSLCLIAGCASSGGGHESATQTPNSRSHDCISQSAIRDYQVLDDSNLIVTAGAKRQYHVQLSRRAFGLRSNWKIGFKSPTGRICSGTGEVIVDDGFGRKESIYTSSITQVDPDQLGELLIRFGKKVPEFEQAPARDEVVGAEVEELD